MKFGGPPKIAGGGTDLQETPPPLDPPLVRPFDTIHYIICVLPQNNPRLNRFDTTELAYECAHPVFKLFSVSMDFYSRSQRQMALVVCKHQRKGYFSVGIWRVCIVCH